MRRLPLGIVMWLAFSSPVHSMPRDLRQVARDVGCAPVVGFFERDGQIEPDYINAHDGRPSTDGSSRSAIWCKSKSDKSFWLVFVTNGQPLQRDGCAPILKWSEKPKGLTIHAQKLPFRSLHQLSNNIALTDVGETSYAPISDTYDGSGYAFYCHQKKWFVAPLH